MWTRIAYFSRETLVSLRRNVLMTIAGIATVAVSLALFGGILMLSKWVDHGTERDQGWRHARDLHEGRRDRSADRRGERRSSTRTRTSKGFRYLDKDAAYAEFQRIFRRKPDLVNSITAADLPVSFRVAPKAGDVPIDKLTSNLAAQYEHAGQGVDDVATPGEALKGLVDVTNTVRNIFIVISLVLLGSSLFLIVNTIRLATFARRREIEVMKLVGASNWFVRVPFIAEGMVQGLVGAGHRDPRRARAQALRLRRRVQRSRQLLQQVLRDHRRRHPHLVLRARHRRRSSAWSAPASACAASCAPDRRSGLPTRNCCSGCGGPAGSSPGKGCRGCCCHCCQCWLSSLASSPMWWRRPG